jgi:hypothetical protein
MEHSMALTRNRSGRVVIEDNEQQFLTFQSSAPHEEGECPPSAQSGRLSMRCNKTRARTVETDLSNGGFLIMGRNSTSDVTQAERELEETRGLVQQQFGIVKRLKRLDADTKEAICLLIDLLELQEKREERLAHLRMRSIIRP